MPRRITPYDIQVRTVRDKHVDLGHAFIEVEAKLQPEDAPAGGWSYAEFLDGRRWVAGVLGRLMLLLAEDLAQESQSHHCRSWYVQGYGPDNCTDAPWSVGMRDPRTAEEPHLVAVQLTVPVERRREWATKVKELLAEITAADAWQPSPADEARWRGVTQPDHGARRPAPEIQREEA